MGILVDDYDQTGEVSGASFDRYKRFIDENLVKFSAGIRDFAVADFRYDMKHRKDCMTRGWNESSCGRWPLEREGKTESFMPRSPFLALIMTGWRSSRIEMSGATSFWMRRMLSTVIIENMPRTVICWLKISTCRKMGSSFTPSAFAGVQDGSSRHLKQITSGIHFTRESEKGGYEVGQMKNVRKLLSFADGPLNQTKPVIPQWLGDIAGNLKEELLQMLVECNGFYAFDRALHVFPSNSTTAETGLTDWNDSQSWRKSYEDLACGCLFFAEDTFGGQFCIKDGGVYTFDPETAGLECLADSVEGWAKSVLDDCDVLTGRPLAIAWRERDGMIPSGMRLMPKTPFVVGGEFSIDNLHLLNATDGMEFRGYLANQIKDLPEGAAIRFEVGD